MVGLGRSPLLDVRDSALILARVSSEISGIVLLSIVKLPFPLIAAIILYRTLSLSLEFFLLCGLTEHWFSERLCKCDSLLRISL